MPLPHDICSKIQNAFRASLPKRQQVFRCRTITGDVHYRHTFPAPFFPSECSCKIGPEAAQIWVKTTLTPSPHTCEPMRPCVHKRPHACLRLPPFLDPYERLTEDGCFFKKADFVCLHAICLLVWSRESRFLSARNRTAISMESRSQR